MIVEKLQSLFGQDILCWRTDFFPKFPGSKGTEWHQVETYKYTTGTSQIEPTIRIEIYTYGTHCMGLHLLKQPKKMDA